jgi:hypothetical protein
MPKSIFISYVRAQRELARPVVDLLKSAGYTVWYARIDDIGPMRARCVPARSGPLMGGCRPRPVSRSMRDISTAAGKCFLDMLGVFAEFETNLRRERQLEGIAKAKAAGVYKGRPASIDEARVRELKAQGMRPTDIAKTLGIGRTSVYRAL